MRAFTYVQSLALRLRKDDSGAVATEYTYLTAFIAIVAAMGMLLFAENLSAFFNDIEAALASMLANLPQPFNT